MEKILLKEEKVQVYGAPEDKNEKEKRD